MHPDSKMARHRPSREHIKLIVAKEGWAVYLAPAAKVVDLAVIQAGLSAVTHAVPATVASGFLLLPRDRTAPPPTAEEFDAIFERGFDASEKPVPMLLRRQAP
jgi:hypothetical protein